MQAEIRAAYLEHNKRFNVRVPKDWANKRVKITQIGNTINVVETKNKDGNLVKVPNAGEDRYGYVSVATKRHGLNFTRPFVHFENTNVNDGKIVITLAQGLVANDTTPVKTVSTSDGDDFIITSKGQQVVERMRDAIKTINDAVNKYNVKISIVGGTLKATMEI